MKIEVHHHYHTDEETRASLSRVFQKLLALEKRIETVMKKIEEVIAAVESETSVVESAVTLLNQLHDLLIEAGTDEAKLTELAAKISANRDALAAAVQANTPAAE